METGEIAVAASMVALATHQDTLTHNLANMQSPGFKRKVGSYAAVAAKAQTGQPGANVAIPYYFESTDYSQGDIAPSNNKMEVAIQGRGFFKVQLPDGETAFTRVGSFQPDEKGYLCTPSGYRVLSIAGTPLQIGAGQDQDLIIDDRGNVSILVHDGNGTKSMMDVGRIGVHSFVIPKGVGGAASDTDATDRLLPMGDGLYAVPDRAGIEISMDRESLIQQSAVERSNANASHELVAMLLVKRSFEANGRALNQIQKARDAFMSVTKG